MQAPRLVRLVLLLLVEVLLLVLAALHQHGVLLRAEEALEARHDVGVDLADPALGEVQHLTDLTHRVTDLVVLLDGEALGIRGPVRQAKLAPSSQMQGADHVKSSTQHVVNRACALVMAGEKPR